VTGTRARRIRPTIDHSRILNDSGIRNFKMPSLIIPESGLSFASSQHASRKPDSTMPTAIGLTLTDGVIEEMIKCFQNGKPIQLSLGDHPVSSWFIRLYFLERIVRLSWLGIIIYSLSIDNTLTSYCHEPNALNPY
jgi:hypothetical protein